jgi:hypothetical protein
VIALATTAEARQIVAERPRIEVGGKVSFLPSVGKAVVGGAPVLSWNLDPRTIVEASVDFHTARTSFVTERRRLGSLQFKRSLFTSGNGRFFAAIGGMAGSSRTTLRSFSAGPAVVTTRDIKGLTIGAGYDHILRSHLALSAEGHVIISHGAPSVRALVGLSVPLGAYRPLRFTSAQSPLSGVSPGQTVWITMRDGRLSSGTLVDSRGTSIDVRSNGVTTTMSLGDILHVEAADRVRDGIGKGALIGAAAGIPLFVYGIGGCGNDSECGYYAVLYGLTWSAIGSGVGAVVGGIIDSLHEGRRTVYQGAPRVTVAPIVTRRGAGVGAVIRW